MSIDQDELQEPQAPGMDEAAWSGAALTFTREDGGQPGPGGLSDRVRLPGQHLHPARRAAAEKLRAAEAKRDALQAEIAARGPERDALQKLWWESQGPERDAVDEELDRHDRRTRRLTEGLPYAEADVRNAWAALASAYWASDGEQKDYVYQRGPELLTQLQAFAEGFQHVAAELQQLVELLHGKNIIHMGQPQTGAEQDARFARDELRRSVEKIAAGMTLPGTEGEMYGLQKIVQCFGNELARPEPAEPQPEIEPVPIPMQNRRRQVGLDPLTGEPVDPFTISG